MIRYQYPSKFNLCPHDVAREDCCCTHKHSININITRAISSPSVFQHEPTAVDLWGDNRLSIESCKTCIGTIKIRSINGESIDQGIDDSWRLTSAMQDMANEFRISSLRRIFIPPDTVTRFEELANSNTMKNVETIGILAGKLEQYCLNITHLIIPEQTGTHTTCEALNEEEIANAQIDKNLITLGWIHSHPRHRAFMSSIDLHTQFSYQKTLPEAIAIVYAPTDQDGKIDSVFSLTDHGLEYIEKCRLRGFHEHLDDPPLYMDAKHITENEKLSIIVNDLRKPGSEKVAGQQKLPVRKQISARVVQTLELEDEEAIDISSDTTESPERHPPTNQQRYVWDRNTEYAGAPDEHFRRTLINIEENENLDDIDIDEVLVPSVEDAIAKEYAEYIEQIKASHDPMISNDPGWSKLHALKHRYAEAISAVPDLMAFSGDEEPIPDLMMFEEPIRNDTVQVKKPKRIIMPVGELIGQFASSESDSLEWVPVTATPPNDDVDDVDDVFNVDKLPKRTVQETLFGPTADIDGSDDSFFDDKEEIEFADDLSDVPADAPADWPVDLPDEFKIYNFSADVPQTSSRRVEGPASVLERYERLKNPQAQTDTREVEVDNRPKPPRPIMVQRTVLYELRTVFVPHDTVDKFAAAAKINTRRNEQTFGILAGVLTQNELRITHLIIPHQKGNADVCRVMDEDEIVKALDDRRVSVLGWIHTQPKGAAFLSELDVHTQLSYQSMLPEAIAIVYAPKDTNKKKYRVFCLTYDGMDEIKKCEKSTKTWHRFHSHIGEKPIVMEAQHVKVKEEVKKKKNWCIIVSDLRNNRDFKMPKKLPTLPVRPPPTAEVTSQTSKVAARSGPTSRVTARSAPTSKVTARTAPTSRVTARSAPTGKARPAPAGNVRPAPAGKATAQPRRT